MLRITPLVRTVLFGVGAVLAALVPAGQASAQLYSNTTPINIPATSIDGVSTPFPSNITVAGAPAAIGYISVTLEGLTHSFVNDIEVLLVSPTGQRIMLMARTNGTASASGRASNARLTFVPDATQTLPSANSDVVSGVYGCSVYPVVIQLPAPAPPTPYSNSLAPLIGTNANGTWSLYVYDTYPELDGGSIARGWSIAFNQTISQPLSTEFTYQGQLSVAGAPLNGNANAKFTLCKSAFAPIAFCTVGSTITKSFTGINNGLVTTSLDYGVGIDMNQQLWLEIQVESPPGSGYVTLSPRQPITPTPQAHVARWAATAPWSGLLDVPDNVTNAFSPWTAGSGSAIAYSLGAVGIGTTSPAPGHLLQVVSATDNAQIGLTSGPPTGGAIAPRTWSIVSASVAGTLTPTTGAFQIVDRSAGLGRLTINTSGNMGLGTSSPIARLHVADGSAINTQLESSNVLGTWFNIFNTSSGGRFWRLISTGSSNGEGAGNLLIGSGTSSGSNTVAMTILGSNSNVGIGITAPTQKLHVAGNVLANNVAVPSSGRFKHNVMPMGDALERLMRLEGVTFDWNSEFAKERPGREHDIGFVAEDVAKVFPEVVFKDPEGLVTGMDYSRLTAVAVQAIKQQQAQREADLARAEAERARAEADRARLDAELTRQRAENAELKARLAAIEAALSEMRKNK